MTKEEYQEYLKTEHWQRLRAERLKIDNYKCQYCGRPYDLQVHHLSYDNLWNENVYEDLITLCKSCHKCIEEIKTKYKDEQVAKWKAQYLAEKEENHKAYKLAKQKLEQEYAERFKAFIKKYQNQDVIYGGNLNLCKLDDIWECFHDAGYDESSIHTVRLTDVQEYFRIKKVKIIQDMRDAGASPEQISKKGITCAMIRKWWSSTDKDLKTRLNIKEDL